MNEKIILPELIDKFSEKLGMNRKDAELFVKSMLDLIVEALEKEKYVKVKGLGTFKLTEVESRESVNVNTGERIEIQGHTKVSFTPDTTMKDLINKPFAHFESVVLNDGVELEDTPIDNIVEENIVNEVPVIEEIKPEPIVETPAPTEEPVEEVPVTEEATVEEPAMEETIAEETIVEIPAAEAATEEEIVTEETVITEEVVTEVQAEEPIPEEPAEETSPMVETVVEEEPQPEMAETKEEVEEKPVFIEEKPTEETIVEEKVATESKEKSINRILWGVIVVLVLIILFGAYWMFFRSEGTPETKPVVPVQEEQMAEPAPVAEEKPQEETLKIVQFIELSEEELRKERVPSFADTLDYQIVGTQEEYTLQKGETIIRASVRFFGTKKFWPYIVKHNMDVLPDPDNIPAGIRIKIPKLVEKK
jgi:nucleoid DNA-binding protein